MMMYHEELFTRSTCLNCKQEIAAVGIQCAECPPPPPATNFRLCTECFAVGAEIGTHQKEHRYCFFDSGSLALFPGSAADLASSSKENNGSGSTITPRWSAKEEIRLLDAIEQYGFGNWQDISKHIESRGSIEAKDEFVQRYVLGNVGKESWSKSVYDPGSDSVHQHRGVFPQPIDHTVPCDEGPLSPSLTQRLPPLDISSDEILQLGYMPFRDDYEKEYDNEAEKLVSQLNFTHEDDEMDISLKLALVDIYSRRLRERSRRKRVIRDYQLVCKFFKKDRARVANGDSNPNSAGVPPPSTPLGGKDQAAKRLQSDEKQLEEKFQPFAQFYNCREFDHLVRNLAKEKDLKLRLQELIKYRSAGITLAEECIDYERLKTVSSGGTPRKRNAATAGLGPLQEEEEDEGRNHKRIQEQSPALIQQLLQPKRELGLGVQNAKNVAVNVSATQNLTQQPSSKGAFNLKNLESSGLGVASLLQEDQFSCPQAGGGVEGAAGGEVVDSFLLREKQKGMVVPFTANFTPPSTDLLTKDEFEMCRKLYLLPAQFLTIKLAFILGRLDKSSPSGWVGDKKDENSFPTASCLPPDLSPSQMNQLLEFFLSNQQQHQNAARQNRNQQSSFHNPHPD